MWDRKDTNNRPGADPSRPVQRKAPGKVPAFSAPPVQRKAGGSGGALAGDALQKARRLNPRFQSRLGFDPSMFGNVPGAGSASFARIVAGVQRRHGLTVDGILGPNTWAKLEPEIRMRDEANARVREADQLEPGVLGPQDELESGVLGPQDELESGVLGPQDELEPGVLGPQDELEPGVLGPQDELEPGVLGSQDELESGVLGPQDELESGVLGSDDVAAMRANRRNPSHTDRAANPSINRAFDDTRAEDPMVTGGRATIDESEYEAANTLESGVIDTSGDPIFQSGNKTASVQRKSDAAADTAAEDTQAIAQHGVSGGGQSLPHLDKIQRSFGQHDVTGVKAHVGGPAAEASDAIGAEAYATGDNVAFRGQPDVHTAAHEAAHVVQQRAGVQLKGGVGQEGDAYERHADQVADLVTEGKSAEGALNTYGQPAQAPDVLASADVQRKPASGAGDGGLDPYTYHSGLAEESRNAFLNGWEVAGLLYGQMSLQAQFVTIGDKIKEDYEKTKEDRKKALEKSDVEKMLEGLAFIIDFSSAASNMVKAGKSVVKSARRLKKAEAGVEAAKGGKDLHDAVAGLSQTADVGELLPDANHQAVVATNAILEELFASQVEINLLTVLQHGRNGAMKLARLVAGIPKDYSDFSDDELTALEASIDRIEEQRKAYDTALKKNQQLWLAYQAGGAQAIADEKENTLFEKIAGWVRTGDPKARTLRVAMDQEINHVDFHGTEEDAEAMGNSVKHYKCHAYEETPIQIAAGRLYTLDADVTKELLDDALLMPAWSAGGAANQHLAADLQKEGSEYWVWQLSTSLCKALFSLGLNGWKTSVQLHLHKNGTHSQTIESAHRDEWFDGWKDTNEFGEFWRNELKGKYGYIMGKDGSRETFAASTEEARENSESLTWHGRNTLP